MSTDVIARSPQHVHGALESWLPGAIDMACEFEDLIHRETGLDPIEIAGQDQELGIRAGFFHASEGLPLFEAAVACGAIRLLAVDPIRNNRALQGDVDAMLRLGSHVMISASRKGLDRQLAMALAAAHPDQLILGLHSGDAAPSLRHHYVAALHVWRELGLGEAEIRRAISDNPGGLLDLDEARTLRTALHG